MADSQPTQVAVVINPVNVEDPSKLQEQLRQACRRRDWPEPSWFQTTKDSPGTEQAARALDEGADLVLACGGDGTVRACASALIGSGIALGLIPAGSGNLLARNLAVPVDIAAAIEVAFGPGRLAIDVAASEPGEYFLIMAGLGFDAAMIELTNQQTKERLGWPAYVGGIARAIRASPSAQFQIAIDGAPALSRRAVGVLLGNVGQLQAGLTVLPAASPTDGFLDLAILAPVRALDWPLILMRMLTRRMDKGGRTEILQGRQIDISCDRALPLEFDGDGAGQAHSLTARALPGALTVCVPHV